MRNIEKRSRVTCIENVETATYYVDTSLVDPGQFIPSKIHLYVLLALKNTQSKSKNQEKMKLVVMYS